MLQLNEVAIVEFSASIRPIGLTKGKLHRRNAKNERKFRRIWLFLFKFKAKHRVRLLQRRPEIEVPNHKTQMRDAPINYKLNKLDTFHRASKSITSDFPFDVVIFFGQIFGLLPVKNIRADSPKDIDFRLASYPIIFTLAFLIFGGLKVIQFTRTTLENGVNTKNMVSLMFFYSSAIIYVRFIFLARNWPQLLRYWTRVELVFLMPPYKPVSNWTLRWKLRLLASIFAVVALFEHCLYFASTYYNYHMVSIHCQLNNTEYGSLKGFIVQEFSDFFSYTSYNIFWAGYSFFLNGAFTYIWSYLDVFIMLVSLSLAVRFQQFAKRIRRLQGHYVSEDIWYELRQHHIQLCELMANIDYNFSDIVLISCTTNMYFICNQLLNIFTKLRWPINYVYFWFSLFYLIGRTTCVFLCAAKIHEASLLPLRSLHLVPSSSWSEEVERFYAQIHDESIALTGKRFFKITRASLFGFMATIIKYEFMLLQFDMENWENGLPPLCK